MTRLLLSLALGAAVAVGCGGSTTSGSGSLTWTSTSTPSGSSPGATAGGGTGSTGGGTSGTPSTPPPTTTPPAGGDPSGSGTGTGTGSGGTSGGTTGAWLTTSSNHILLPGGAVWHGRGANLPDFRGCGSSLDKLDVPELERRVDTLVDGWHANLVRLDLESHSTSASGSAPTVLADPNYLAAVEQVVRYMESKNIYVELSLWLDPTFDANGWPTSGTRAEWQKLATEFAHDDRVLFGLVNEPQNNSDGSQDPQVWTAMNDTVQTIRDAEVAAGGGTHVVAVQGTGGWSRYASYYVTHPITAGAGKNVAYEIHIYNPQSEFDSLLSPASAIPLLVGEFGPDQTMSQSDAQALMGRLQQLEVPHIAWAFHMRCSPDLLQDSSGGGDGTGMALQPTAWGSALQSSLAQSW
jgi:hypothetical protein